MTDNQWLKRHITNPSEEELYFFVEKVHLILDGYTPCDEILEKAREQAFEELNAHDF